MNAFINFVKKFLVERTKGRIKVLKDIKTSLLLILDLFTGL